MPFTFAHPVAVLPLGIKKNKYFDFTALFLGSMAPDFEYFIHFEPYQLYGHTILGQLFYNLPLVLVVSYIYHYVLKESIIFNLPKPYCGYYYYMVKTRWKLNSIRAFITFVYSALIGMFTHLIWDSFTHKSGYFVTKIVIINNSISLMDYDVPIYKILQHGSTIIGLLILLVYLFRIQDKNTSYYIEISGVSKTIFWISFLVLYLFISIGIIVVSKDFSLGRIVVGSISAGFISITIISFIDKVNRLFKIKSQSNDV